MQMMRSNKIALLLIILLLIIMIIHTQSVRVLVGIHSFYFLELWRERESSSDSFFLLV
jgi:hypothetical protein